MIITKKLKAIHRPIFILFLLSLQNIRCRVKKKISSATHIHRNVLGTQIHLKTLRTKVKRSIHTKATSLLLLIFFFRRPMNMNNFNFFFLFHWHTLLDYMYELKEARKKKHKIKKNWIALWAFFVFISLLIIFSWTNYVFFLLLFQFYFSSSIVF